MLASGSGSRKTGRCHAIKAVERLRIVLLEGMGQAIGEASLVGDQLTTLFGEAEQCAHVLALRLQRGKSLWVAHEKIQGKFGIGGIFLGATGFESLTLFGKSRRVDGKEHQEVVLLQCVDNWALGQFKTDIERALRDRFGALNVVRGEKAINIKENTYRVSADVVPCTHSAGGQASG